MTQAHRVETILAEDGRLFLDQLPFRAGQTVEVIVMAASESKSMTPVELLRGSVLRYDRPTDPVADSDWEAST